ncbi:MAG TPA: DUF342 domain-containing protein [Firmicutes bacterium]|nr:DUF342 domain-containing protein [Bacillota bacterium]
MGLESAWDLHVSEDRMSAELTVTTGYQGSAEDLLKSLRQAGITYGVLATGIEEALANRNAPVQVAAGLPPEHGRDDSIIFAVPREALLGEITLRVGTDLHRAYEIPSVKPGQLLAELIPGTPGKEGRDVYGKSVAPPRIRQYRLAALSGTKLSADKNRIYAASAGRPHLEVYGTQYRFHVQPVFFHRNDLTLETAHLVFDGDIVVQGSVLEGTTVTAMGQVDILGNVVGATVTAGQSIRVTGNVIQSTVRAGYDFVLLQETLPLLEQVLQMLSGLSNILEQLDKQGRMPRLPFALVVEKAISLQYGTYGELCKQLTAMLEKAAKKIPGLSGTLDAANIGAKLNYRSWEGGGDLAAAASALLAAREALHMLIENTADVTLAYALNSSVTASGRILVRGQGSFHSRLVAGKEVEITGITRGGSVTAENKIKAGIVGSDAGALTLLSVGKRGSMEIDSAFENTVFTVGESRQRLTGTVKRVRVVLDRDGLVHLRPRD